MENLGKHHMTEKSQQVASRFAEEGLRGKNNGDYLNSNPDIKPFSLNQYRDTCTELLNKEDVLPDELLDELLINVRENARIKEYFRPGESCCLAVIPFSNYGFPLDDSEIEDGAYLRFLIINSQGVTIDGFSLDPSYISKLLPVEIQQAAFQIPPYDNQDLYSVTERDRENLSAQVKQSFKKLQSLLK